jgi:hypothetical protein
MLDFVTHICTWYNKVHSAKIQRQEGVPKPDYLVLYLQYLISNLTEFE